MTCVSSVASFKIIIKFTLYLNSFTSSLLSHFLETILVNHFKFISKTYFAGNTNSELLLGSDSNVKREIVIKPSKNTAYIGQNFELKCDVTTVRNQLRRQPRYYGSAAGYTKWSKVDGYMSPNVRNFGGNTIRYSL